MTDYPCLADTASIDLALPDAYLTPNLNLDPDATNALELRDSGLYAPPSAMPSTRIYQIASQAVGSGAQITFAAMRWQSSNASWGGSFITTQVAGLWLFGASIAFSTGGTAGSIWLNILPSTGTTLIASDTANSIGATAYTLASPQTHGLNPSGMAYLPAGTNVGCYCPHTFGGSINTVVMEAAGAEFWACLVRPYVAGDV